MTNHHQRLSSFDPDAAGGIMPWTSTYWQVVAAPRMLLHVTTNSRMLLCSTVTGRNFNSSRKKHSAPQKGPQRGTVAYCVKHRYPNRLMPSCVPCQPHSATELGQWMILSTVFMVGTKKNHQPGMSVKR